MVGVIEEMDEVVCLDESDVDAASGISVVVAVVRVEANNVVDGSVLTIGLLDDEAAVESVIRGELVEDAKDIGSGSVVTVSGVVDPMDVFVNSVVNTDADDSALRVGFVEEANEVVAGLVLVMASLVDESDVDIGFVVSAVVCTDAAVVRTVSIAVVGMSVIAEDV